MRTFYNELPSLENRFLPEIGSETPFDVATQVLASRPFLSASSKKSVPKRFFVFLESSGNREIGQNNF